MRILLLSPTDEGLAELIEHLTDQGNEVFFTTSKSQLAVSSNAEGYDVSLLAVDPSNPESIAHVENWSAANPAIPAVLLCTNANVDRLPQTLAGRARAIHSMSEDPRVLVASMSNCLEHNSKQSRIALARGDPHRDRLWKEISAASSLSNILESRETLLQTVIDAIPEVTILIDREHKILLANRAANEIAGGNPVEQGLMCYQLLHRRDSACSGRDHPCSLQCVLARKIPQSLTHRHYDHDGNDILVEVRAIPILDENGEVVQMLESCRDITEYDRLKGRVSATEKAIEDHLSASHALVGTSPAIRKVRRLIAQGAPTDFTILILGESGVGKSLVAGLIHKWSGREGEGPFQVVNCPAIPEHLIESEMFGYEKGAFTNAFTRKPGRLEMAPGGTIFLDEIGLVPVSIQSKLLHVIEKKEFVRLGGHNTMKLNSRFVVATNADLKAMVHDGRFRSDLYFRLNQFPIHIPPLRERKEDIVALAHHFVDSPRESTHSKTIPEVVIERLLAYDWPGNVRELKTVIERYVLTGELQDFDSMATPTPSPSSRFSRLERFASVKSDTKRTLDVAEREAIYDALVSTRWNLRRAAERLGIGYGALRYRIEKYGMKSE